MTEGDRALIRSIASEARHPDRNEKQKAHLHRAAGKAYDDIGDYEAAMEHFEESNQISERMSQASGQVFLPEALRDYTDLLISAFTAENLREFSINGSQSELPVLIVGMIRSGTTLLDQILSRHPSVASAGELNYWTGARPGALLKEFLNGHIDQAHAEDVCREYRLLLKRAGPAKKRIIDKMPMNFLGIGLIHLLFPKAKIVHCRRHPVDNALSIFVTELGSPRANFAVSRRNIVLMYRQYERLMKHWREVLPTEQFLEIDYEALVSDPESEVRKAIEFIGLPWDERCLQSHAPETVVTTPSAWQARQPIYSTSLDRWRKYEPWLGELKDLLPDSSQRF